MKLNWRHGASRMTKTYSAFDSVNTNNYSPLIFESKLVFSAAAEPRRSKQTERHLLWTSPGVAGALRALTSMLGQPDRPAGLRGLADAILVDGAHSKAVLPPLDQVESREARRAHQRVQTGQLPAVLPRHGLDGEREKDHIKNAPEHIYYSVS